MIKEYNNSRWGNTKKYFPLNNDHLKKINLKLEKTDFNLLKSLRVYFFFNSEIALIKSLLKFTRYPEIIKKINYDFEFMIFFEKNNIKLCKKTLKNFELFNFNFDEFLEYEKADQFKKFELSNLKKYGQKSVMQVLEIKEKQQKTFEKKYGDKNYFKTDVFKETRKKSLKNRFGVEDWFLSEDFKNRKDEIVEKTKNTKKEKYGDEKYNNRKKARQTSLERYGKENFSQTEEYKIKSKHSNLERYGVESYTQTEEYQKRRKNTSLEKYGFDSFFKIHLKNFENLNENFVKQNFIKDSRFLIDEFEEYFNILTRKTSIKYKRMFNITEINKSNHLRTQQYIFDSINIENKIFNDRHLGKELDIYIPEYNLAIEYDGLMFHSDGISDHNMFKNTDKNYHLQKTELCLKNNIQLFHIFGREDLGLWLSMINNKLNLNEKIYARKCIIKELNSQDTIEFLNENHLQGFFRAKVNVGLFYNEELVSLMTFSKPRFNKNYEYELIRFCSKRNTSVIGGATKLWKYFVTKYNPHSVITYANRRFSNGEIYKKLGFTFLEKTSPNYFYFSRNTKLESRIKYQKHKLQKIKDFVFDEKLSEAENMFNNGYRRIFDCGNLKFVWIKQ